MEDRTDSWLKTEQTAEEMGGFFLKNGVRSSSVTDFDWFTETVLVLGMKLLEFKQYTHSSGNATLHHNYIKCLPAKGEGQTIV